MWRELPLLVDLADGFGRWTDRRTAGLDAHFGFHAPAPGEPLEMWGIAAREAYHDHSTHYWAPMEPLVDALGKVVDSAVRDGVQNVRWRPDGLRADVDEIATLLVPRAPDTARIKLHRDGSGKPHPPAECRLVQVGGAPFWLMSCPLK